MVVIYVLYAAIRYIIISDFLPLIIRNTVPVPASVKTAVLGLWLKANNIKVLPVLRK